MSATTGKRVSKGAPASAGTPSGRMAPRACLSFKPNPWRTYICRNCFRGFSEHPQARGIGAEAPLWYYAKVEGPFSWEQMRHWLDSGYLRPDKMLLRATPQGTHPSFGGGGAWQDFRNLFPDDDAAFLPENADDVMRAAAGIAMEERRQKELLADRLRKQAVAKGRERVAAELAGDDVAASRAAAEEQEALRGSKRAEEEAARDGQVAEAASKPEQRMVSQAEIRRYKPWVKEFFSQGKQWYFIDADEK